jgi:hypothetical protein
MDERIFSLAPTRFRCFTCFDIDGASFVTFDLEQRRFFFDSFEHMDDEANILAGVAGRCLIPTTSLYLFNICYGSRATALHRSKQTSSIYTLPTFIYYICIYDRNCKERCIARLSESSVCNYCFFVLYITIVIQWLLLQERKNKVKGRKNDKCYSFFK